MYCYEYGCKGKHLFAFAPYNAVWKTRKGVSEKQETIIIIQ